MGEASEIDAMDLENCKAIGSDLNMTQLDDPEGGRLSINCVNSSEFVVGKQTNFNGPVTIINCAQTPALKRTNPQQDKEMIVIRDEVLSRSAAIKLEEKAEETGKDSVDPSVHKKNLPEKWRLGVKSCVLENRLAIPAAVCVALAVATGITLALLYLQREVSPEEDSGRTCIKVEKLEKKVCIYSGLHEAQKQCESPKTVALETPVSFVAISETKGKPCYSPEACLENLRFKDCEGSPGCNFLAGLDGNVYEVSGWNGSNALRGPPSGRSLLLCLVGDFAFENYPTYPQVEATKALIALGVEKNFISSDYVLWAENATSGDGDRNSIYRIVKKWPKFRRQPFFESDESSKEVQTQDDRFSLYSKEDWGGEPPTSVIEMKLPVPYVVVSHSVTPQCRDLSSCSPRIQSIQGYGLSNELADIAYSFLLDSGGHVYEGRGWTSRNSKGGFVNGRNINVCFIGDFSRKVKPTEKQFEALKSLIDYGVATGKVSKDYSLISDNSTHATLSPGKNVYEVIKNWPHFDPNPKTSMKKYDD